MTAVLAIAIFIADTATPVDITFATLYVVVVLLAARFCRPRGVWGVTVGCVFLVVLSFFLTPP
ncbi:MAG TPA: two-component sensor histidine kinase, partial [Acidocella sp.]|nr:two-component sensor histidine kinase [Acidocella sp.]